MPATLWRATGANTRREPAPGVQWSDWQLEFADLTDADLRSGNLFGADVSMAILSASGIASDQLYSTSTYAAKSISGIGLGLLSLVGWDLSD